MGIDIFVSDPFYTEVFFFACSLAAFTITLWLISRSDLKKRDFLTAFRVSLIAASIPFLMRIVDPLFGYQPFSMKTLSLPVEIALLVALIKITYKPSWKMTAFTWISAYGAKWLTIMLVTLAIIFSTPSLAAIALGTEPSLEEKLVNAEMTLGFEIKQPTYLPEGYSLSYVADSGQLTYYNEENDTRLILRENKNQYGERNLTFIKDPFYDISLTWSTENVTFRLSMDGRNNINQSEMLKIAESIK